MKNKTIMLLVVLALLALPAVASAQVEFTLGGYIKLEAFWDSAALGKNINTAPPRNNDPNAQHGRFNATSQSSRFNFTIKGPDLWGAKTTGYLEMDFDASGDARQSSSNAYAPRMRHAFFRMNWPGTELLMGQYWGMFCDFYPETVQDGPFQGHGVATQRLPQVRVTQTFGLGWAKDDKMTLSALVGKPADPNDSSNPNYIGGTPAAPNPQEGQTSETPQVQAKIQYDGDLWGKAGFYGAPRGFTAQVAAGWQRTRYRDVAAPAPAPAPVAIQRDQQYQNNWVVQGALFIPIIPTATKNLAGTAALTVQAYVGQGLDFIGNQTGFNSYLAQVADSSGALFYDRKLTQVWGGMVQGNYYFSNQWFMMVAAGLGNNFGVKRADVDPAIGGVNGANLVHQWWEADAVLYYRPIQAFKFGLGYVYTRADYYNTTAVGSNRTNIGEAHSVRFAGWFFF